MLPSAALASFHGWPGLEVLKINGCNLFGRLTALHIPEVQDVQVSHHDHVIGINKVRVHKNDATLDEVMCLSDLPHCACFLVELRVVFQSVLHAAAVVQGVQHLLSGCQSLQCLHLTNCGFKQPYHSHEQADLVLQGQQAVSLQDLRLQNFCFTQIDLCRACSLTSLVVKYVDAPHNNDCKLFLPRGLRCFEFRGRLFVHQVTNSRSRTVIR